MTQDIPGSGLSISYTVLSFFYLSTVLQTNVIPFDLQLLIHLSFHVTIIREF